MKFTEKNNFIVKHKSERFFEQDLELFRKHCPNSKLHSDLKRVNSFNRSILSGKILYELLDKVSPEEILNNRTKKPTEQVIETVEQAINIIKEVDPEFLPERLDKNDLDAIAKEAIGKSVVAFRAIVCELLKKEDSITTVDSIEGIKQILLENEIDPDTTAEEFLLFLVGKTQEEILDIVHFGKQVNPSVVVDVKVSDGIDKPDEVTNETPGDRGTTDSGSEKQPSAEETLEVTTEVKPETVKTPKKKEVNKKSSPK